MNSQIQTTNSDDAQRFAAAGITRSDAASPACPVCLSHCTDPLDRPTAADYWQCALCWAVYLHPSRRLSPQAEAAHYRLHQNDVDDPHYRRFLSRLATPLLGRLAPAAEGLDFGCGPGPALAAMLAEAGHKLALYDPVFMPDPAPLSRSYDFVVCSEVVEHLRDPATEFERLLALLKPGGVLAIMTGFAPAPAQFADWHYRRDPTHVVFYRPATFRWLARRHAVDCDIPATNVAMLTRRLA